MTAPSGRPALIVLAGLPGSGKSALAREIARRIGAVHLRIDSIEQEIRGAGGPADLADVGYRVAYAAARDDLALGRSIVADAVNPLQVTRDAWRAVGDEAGADVVEIEVICSDVREHRRRVESRATDIAGLRLPTWDEVVAREYEPWARDRWVVDTAGRSLEQSVEEVLALLPMARGED